MNTISKAVIAVAAILSTIIVVIFVKPWVSLAKSYIGHTTIGGSIGKHVDFTSYAEITNINAPVSAGTYVSYDVRQKVEVKATQEQIDTFRNNVQLLSDMIEQIAPDYTLKFAKVSMNVLKDGVTIRDFGFGVVAQANNDTDLTALSSGIATLTWLVSTINVVDHDNLGDVVNNTDRRGYKLVP